MTNPPPQYAWLVTLQWTTPDGRTDTATATGTVAVHQNSTREALMSTALFLAREQIGAPSHAPVLYLSLEPNDLPS